VNSCCPLGDFKLINQSLARRNVWSHIPLLMGMF